MGIDTRILLLDFIAPDLSMVFLPASTAEGVLASWFWPSGGFWPSPEGAGEEGVVLEFPLLALEDCPLLADPDFLGFILSCLLALLLRSAITPKETHKKTKWSTFLA